MFRTRATVVTHPRDVASVEGSPGRSRRRGASAALVLAGLAALSACSGDGFSTAPQALASCPDPGVLSVIGIDVTASGHDEASKARNLGLVERRIDRTALCGGHASVFMFASSSGATSMVFDGDLRVDAPTENARARKAEKLADEAMKSIHISYDAALAGTSGTGTDVLGMLPLFEQAGAQFPDLTAEYLLSTDGLTNVSVDPTTAADADAARTLADQQSVPDLSGASLQIVGIGKLASGEVPSATVAAVTAFWEQVCQNTGASTCQVSTEGQ